MKKSGRYIVYFVEERRTQLYSTWDEADLAMRGHPHLCKKVYSEEEARTWVGSITVKDIARARLYG